MPLYELAVLGEPTAQQIDVLKQLLDVARSAYGLAPDDVAFHVRPADFRPNPRACAAALLIGGPHGAAFDVASVMDFCTVPVLPVVSTGTAVSLEVPPPLRNVNCLFLDQAPLERVLSGMLECVGLLPRQRRVFLSYRRSEATPAAVQLFAELSERQFDVFLDTHSIGAGVDFQEQLWHQLSDVDVLIMLETPGYFKSRWTDAEYGRALAKGLGVLRVQWPDATPSATTSTASRVELLAAELGANGQLANSALQRVCRQLEAVRSLSHALRTRSLIDSVRNALELIEGRVEAMGPGLLIHATLRNGRKLCVQPTVGVPTAVTLEEALLRAGHDECAVVYNHYGMMRRWQEHLDWLAARVGGSRWIKQSDAAWDFAGWETR